MARPDSIGPRPEVAPVAPVKSPLPRVRGHSTLIRLFRNQNLFPATLGRARSCSPTFVQYPTAGGSRRREFIAVGEAATLRLTFAVNVYG